MSLKHQIALDRLEARLNALEERIALLEAESGVVPPGRYRAVHKGFGHWTVEGGEDYPTMAKAEALRIAAELNG